MNTPKAEQIGPVYRTSDVARAAGCSVRTARRHVPDLRQAKGQGQRTFNALEFKYAVQIVQERMRQPSPRRLKREAKKEARERAEMQQRAGKAAKRRK